jgi:hypothetical protein
VLPTASTQVFGLLPCDEMSNGDLFLRVDCSVDCGAKGRAGVVAFAALMLLAYPVGVPATFGALLARNKERIKGRGGGGARGGVGGRDTEDEELEVNGIAFLWEPYKPVSDASVQSYNR